MKQPKPPNGEAERLFQHPLLNAILNQLENDALEIVVNTRQEDERIHSIYHVRSIRALRQALKTLAEGKTPIPPKGAVV